MAVYRCRICGAIFDEAKEGKKLSEIPCCPVCKQPVSNFEKIADAFGYKYISVKKGSELDSKLEQALSENGPVFCEVFTDTTQVWEPKSSARRNPDGTLDSPPLEDLAPFLPREELKANMYIDF